MPGTIIVINDCSLNVIKNNNIIYSSSGFAYIDKETIIFGKQAENNQHLKPRQTHYHHWQELSQSPLLNPTPHYKNHADIIYQHIINIKQTCNLNENVILAIPSHYKKEQIELLSGIFEASELPIDFIIDASIFLTFKELHNNNEKQAIFIDLQQNQTVITNISIEKEIKKEAIKILPNISLQHFFKSISHHISQTFIQQCRFDPLDNADNQQTLYKKIPDIIKQCNPNRNISLTIDKRETRILTDDIINLIKTNLIELNNKNKINKKILLSPSWGVLSKHFINPVKTINIFDINYTLNEFNQKTNTKKDSIQLINSLQNKKEKEINKEKTETISHLIINNKVYEIDSNKIYYLRNNNLNVLSTNQENADYQISLKNNLLNILSSNTKNNVEKSLTIGEQAVINKFAIQPVGTGVIICE